METVQFEPRLAHLETHMEHMRSDVSEIKVELRGLSSSMNDKHAQLIEKMGDIKVWTLTVLGGGLGFGILGVLARALHWI